MGFVVICLPKQLVTLSTNNSDLSIHNGDLANYNGDLTINILRIQMDSAFNQRT